MDKKLKAKWVKALRSGKYKQCKGYLHDDGAYCCIGVLQKLVTGEIPPRRWASDDVDAVPAEMQFLRINDRELEVRLARMNDGVGGYEKHTFQEIADYIEQNL